MSIIGNAPYDKADVFLSHFRQAQRAMKLAAEAMLTVSKVAHTSEFSKRYDQIHKRLARLVRQWNSIEHQRETGFWPSFQDRVQPWMWACFGKKIAHDREERNHRFLEESLELVQACGCTAEEAHQLVDYVFGRPIGEKSQEVGGVMVTLAALCLAQGLDMHADGETELERIWTKVDQIRAKQAAKPKFSPLPE